MSGEYRRCYVVLIFEVQVPDGSLSTSQQDLEPPYTIPTESAMTVPMPMTTTQTQDRPAPFRRQSGLIAAKVSLTILEKLAKSIPVVGAELGNLVQIAKGIVGLVEVRRFGVMFVHLLMPLYRNTT